MNRENGQKSAVVVDINDTIKRNSLSRMSMDKDVVEKRPFPVNNRSSSVDRMRVSSRDGTIRLESTTHRKRNDTAASANPSVVSNAAALPRPHARKREVPPIPPPPPLPQLIFNSDNKSLRDPMTFPDIKVCMNDSGREVSILPMGAMTGKQYTNDNSNIKAVSRTISANTQDSSKIVNVFGVVPTDHMLKVNRRFVKVNRAESKILHKDCSKAISVYESKIPVLLPPFPTKVAN